MASDPEPSAQDQTATFLPPPAAGSEDGLWTMSEGFLRPDWTAISRLINSTFPEEQRPAAWHQASLQFLEAIQRGLGPEYHPYESKNFLMLTTKSREGAAALLRISERALALIRASLQELAWDWKNGKHIVVLFEDLDSYYRYVSHFYPDGEHSVSAGMLIRGDYCHTVAAPSQYDLTPVLFHEYTHLCLAHLRIPRWVNEGLAAFTECNLTGISPTSGVENREYWTPQTIQDFWFGKSFREPDAAVGSYLLAEILMENISNDFENYRSFVKEARIQDAGEEAARKHFGAGLSDIAATYLGPGDWTPKPAPPGEART